MKAFSRVLLAMVAAIAALFVGTGTSHAGLDNELSLVDGKDRTLTIQQWCWPSLKMTMSASSVLMTMH